MATQAAADGLADYTSPVQVRVPSILRCGLHLMGVKFALKTLGFARTGQLIGKHARKAQLVDRVDRALVAAMEHRVAIAGALYPGRALCLEQSLVLWYCLRRVGVPADFRMGVQSHPFVAHAWVEYQGEVINDVLEHVKWFTPLLGSAV